MLETCGEACGWTAAILAMIFFGSYSVPYKCDASEKVNVDPLVFQTYRTFVSFAVSWLVLLLGAKFTFTPWGIVSGFCWVPGGVAGVWAVRNAGLAVSQGVWSCLVVMVSISWGIFVFHENVSTVIGACCAAVLLMLGLSGMSYYSSPKTQKRQFKNRCLSYSLPYVAGDKQNGRNNDTAATESTSLCNGNGIEEPPVHDAANDEPTIINEEDPPNNDGSTNPASYGSIEKPPPVVHYTVLGSICGGVELTQHQAGVAAAIFNGLFAGTLLVPLHYAGPDNKGLQFVISLGIGAVIATVTLWLGRYLYNVTQTGSLVAAYVALPSFHARAMWRPGFLAGTLYSVGNICGIMAVTGLGLGIGQSVVQASMLISGLWGLFWYKEVAGTRGTILWLLSASVALTGVLWLSQEHQPI